MSTTDTDHITRSEYMADKVTHRQYYAAIADCLGRNALTGLVPATESEIVAALAQDENLNAIPLRKWDARHDFVVLLVQHNLRALEKITESRGWSLSDTVCVLKEVAREWTEREAL